MFASSENLRQNHAFQGTESEKITNILEGCLITHVGKTALRKTSPTLEGSSQITTSNSVFKNL